MVIAPFQQLSNLPLPCPRDAGVSCGLLSMQRLNSIVFFVMLVSSEDTLELQMAYLLLACSVGITLVHAGYDCCQA